MSTSLKRITVRGFKSIESLEDFELRNLNILIGANGAGKSNFVEFFRMLREMAKSRLMSYVNRAGGSDVFFYMGPDYTHEISVELVFNSQSYYGFKLEPTSGDLIDLWGEVLGKRSATGESHEFVLPRSSDGRESTLKKVVDQGASDEAPEVSQFLVGLSTVHLNNTSYRAATHRDQSVNDKYRLAQDASNIASFLLEMSKENKSVYYRVRDAVRHVAPFFDDFLLIPERKGKEEKVRLQWKQIGSDYPFQPYQLSDGTIRFICLATASLQPDPPSLLIIDEPELGLHPFAIGILAELIQTAATQTQVIVSTQSPLLLDHFTCEDVIVVNRDGDRSVFERLNEEDYNVWLEEYSLGELWQKNVVEGGPD